jgi:hypothetical protein
MLLLRNLVIHIPAAMLGMILVSIFTEDWSIWWAGLLVGIFMAIFWTVVETDK